jgi:hypothetical protein
MRKWERGQDMDELLQSYAKKKDDDWSDEDDDWSASDK